MRSQLLYWLCHCMGRASFQAACQTCSAPLLLCQEMNQGLTDLSLPFQALDEAEQSHTPMAPKCSQHKLPDPRNRDRQRSSPKQQRHNSTKTQSYDHHSFETQTSSLCWLQQEQPNAPHLFVLYTRIESSNRATANLLVWGCQAKARMEQPALETQERGGHM